MKYKVHVRKKRNDGHYSDGQGSIIKPKKKDEPKISVVAHVRSDGTHVTMHEKKKEGPAPEINDMGKALMKQQLIETGMEFLKNNPDLSTELRGKIRSNIQFQEEKRQKFLDMFYRERMRQAGLL